MDKSTHIENAPEYYGTVANPTAVVATALLFLGDAYAMSAAYKDYASTADNKAEEQRYNRRALKTKAKGIVHHDRILASGKVVVASAENDGRSVRRVGKG